MIEWTKIEAPIDLPPEGVKVWTMICEGGDIRNECELVRRGGLWFSGDMYVYYTPTHWRVRR